MREQISVSMHEAAFGPVEFSSGNLLRAAQRQSDRMLLKSWSRFRSLVLMIASFARVAEE